MGYIVQVKTFAEQGIEIISQPIFGHSFIESPRFGKGSCQIVKGWFRINLISLLRWLPPNLPCTFAKEPYTFLKIHPL